MKTILCFYFFIGMTTLTQSQTPVELADLQLKGYNERNIDLFLEAYSDSVKVYSFPDKLLYTGKETMRMNYTGMFSNLTDLHCTIKSRMVLGNTVIDEERVLLRKEQPLLEAIAIYKIDAGKIQEVYFIMKDR